MFCKFLYVCTIPVAQNVGKSDNPEFHTNTDCQNVGKSDNPEYSQISYVQYTDCQNVGKSDNPEHF